MLEIDQERHEDTKARRAIKFKIGRSRGIIGWLRQPRPKAAGDEQKPALTREVGWDKTVLSRQHRLLLVTPMMPRDYCYPSCPSSVRSKFVMPSTSFAALKLNKIPC